MTNCLSRTLVHKNMSLKNNEIQYTMNEEIQIGRLLAVEYQKKRWPKVTIIVSLFISAFVVFLSIKDSLYERLFFVLIYWALFLLVQMYRFTRKKIIKFGTEGFIQYIRTRGNVSQKVIMYKDLSVPKFNIVDHQVNGHHSFYMFTIDFGSLRFDYTYDHDDVPTNDFDYIYAHRLYRCWTRYAWGKETDYEESSRIALGMVNNMMKDLKSK